jgi:hypothetical protein
MLANPLLSLLSGNYLVANAVVFAVYAVASAVYIERAECVAVDSLVVWPVESLAVYYPSKGDYFDSNYFRNCNI